MSTSRLGKKFSELGAPGWDEFFPHKICGRCELAIKCEVDEYCAAILAIEVTGLIAIGSQESAKRFVHYFRTVSEAQFEFDAELIF